MVAAAVVAVAWGRDPVHVGGVVAAEPNRTEKAAEPNGTERVVSPVVVVEAGVKVGVALGVLGEAVLAEVLT